MTASTLTSIRHAAGRALDLLLPPLCLSCDEPVGEHRTLCPRCWSGIYFIVPPFCASCGVPFDVPMGDDAQCGGCIAEPPEFASARAPMLYDDASRRIVLAFKHADRTYPAAALAGWMRRAGAAFWADADFIVPVPLHRWRLFKRRYNQAALLVLQLQRLTGKAALVDLLLRVRATPMQGHMNRSQRQDNVKGAFAINPRCRSIIEDKIIVLVDDVYTTGATINECSRILLKAGAKKVHVLTLARVRGTV